LIGRDRFRCSLAPFICANAPLAYAGLVPERVGNAQRFDSYCSPPRLFVADAVHLAVMRPAQRDSELITGLAPQRTRLRVPEVMGVGWLAATDEACLSGHVAQMVLVAVAARLGEGELSWVRLRFILI
jgi:hypothetical protein